MDIIELFNEINEEIKYEIKGELSCDGELIKWQYDSFGRDYDDDMDDHLNEICEIDKDIIANVVEDINADCNMTEVTIEETIIYFYIEK